MATRKTMLRPIYAGTTTPPDVAIEVRVVVLDETTGLLVGVSWLGLTGGDFAGDLARKVTANLGSRRKRWGIPRECLP